MSSPRYSHPVCKKRQRKQKPHLIRVQLLYSFCVSLKVSTPFPLVCGGLLEEEEQEEEEQEEEEQEEEEEEENILLLITLLKILFWNKMIECDFRRVHCCDSAA